MKLAPYGLVSETNRAHALLFLGRTEEAVAVYIAHKGEIVSENRKWEEIIPEDFAEFRSRGLDHPELARVEKALAEAPRSAHAQEADEFDALNKQAEALKKQGKVVEAIEAAKRALAFAEEKFGLSIPTRQLALLP